MEIFTDQMSNSTERERYWLTLPADNTDSPYRPSENKRLKKRSFFLATIATALALLPLSFYGLAGAQDSGAAGLNSADATDVDLQFNLVPAADAIAPCFPDATVKAKVLLTAEERGTDTLLLTAKRLRPDTKFGVFLTELPAAPFGAVRYLADLTTNANGRGSVQVNANIGNAFISQVIDGQGVRRDLNHVVLWFADPVDANECFAPLPAPVTPFDRDGVAGPAAVSSKNALPGAPLP